MEAIRYIKHADIDKEKWDQLITSSPPGLLYALSGYLGAMCSQWDALVSGDYKIAMPLPYRKKMGISYLYQPAFTQQLGIISLQPITEKDTIAFIKKAVSYFSFAEITLNHQNIFTDTKYPIQLRQNLVLPIRGNYEQVQAGYSFTLKKNLKWIKKFNSEYVTDIDAGKVVTLYRELYQKKIPSFKNNDYAHFLNACKNIQPYTKVYVRAVVAPTKELLAASILIHFKDRLYNIISCNTAQGRAVHANDVLYDQIIREFSGQGLLLDFEGSDAAGIARFYRKFGGQNQPYPFLKYNHLPAILKLFKP
ncbi:MAG: hypothetical protein IPL97_08560 [Niastella sp.]|nr:hypothetical protein [Niastella sp.]